MTRWENSQSNQSTQIMCSLEVLTIGALTLMQYPLCYSSPQYPIPPVLGALMGDEDFENEGT